MSHTVPAGADSAPSARAASVARHGSISVAREISSTPRGSLTDISMAHRESLGLNARTASMNAMTARSAIQAFLRCSKNKIVINF